MRKSVLLAAGLLALGAGAAAAQEQEAPRGKRAGDIVVGLGAIGVLPTNGGSVPLINGNPIGDEVVQLNGGDTLELAGTRMQFVHV